MISRNKRFLIVWLLPAVLDISGMIYFYYKGWQIWRPGIHGMMEHPILVLPWTLLPLAVMFDVKPVKRFFCLEPEDKNVD